MNPLMYAALGCHAVIVVLEARTLGALRRKAHILKYYTYLQNLLAMLVSGVFAVGMIVSAVTGNLLPPWLKGLHYITLCGLLTAALIYLLLLASNPVNRLSARDFRPGFSPFRGDLTLHGICPAVSLAAFLMEHSVPLTDGIWTAFAPLPSGLYWIVYLLLSVFRLWQEPYDFSRPDGKKRPLLDALIILAIPAGFILISFLLWQTQ